MPLLRDTRMSKKNRVQNDVISRNVYLQRRRLSLLYRRVVVLGCAIAFAFRLRRGTDSTLSEACRALSMRACFVTVAGICDEKRSSLSHRTMFTFYVVAAAELCCPSGANVIML